MTLSDLFRRSRPETSPPPSPPYLRRRSSASSRGRSPTPVILRSRSPTLALPSRTPSPSPSSTAVNQRTRPHSLSASPPPLRVRRPSPSPTREKRKVWFWRFPPRSQKPLSPSSPETIPVCPICTLKPVARDHGSGNYFDYCSRGCARKAKNSNSNNKGGQSDKCEQCQIKPKFKDGSTVHPYCGRTCAKIAANNGSVQKNPQNTSNAPQTQQQTLPNGTCRTPGCSLPVFTHQDGSPSDYCTEAHEELGEKGCISCRLAPMIDLSVLCQSCHDSALSRAPMIIEVPKGHNSYKSVESQFKLTWRHNVTSPQVMAVYKVIVTQASLDQYQRYLDSVEARGNFALIGKSRGNENRRWHGTKRKCYLGDPGRTTFCNDMGCSLCCIIKSSFDLKYCKTATGWGRFGNGIYTSSTSSKSNDYASNVAINSTWRALLLNKVVVGNGKKLVNDNTSLTAPPPGFDSVLAEVTRGGSVNYDELIVYRNDAVRPSYLVMYKS